MNKLETTYLGLRLRNPIILSSSGYTSTVEKVKQAEAAGVGAVVLKSIFEEQILGEIANLDKYSDYPEASDYLHSYMSENSLNTYLELIRGAKAECAIPVIASINCTEGGEWAKYAREIEAAGADALELNIFELPTDREVRSAVLEERYLDIISLVRSQITIPLSIKMAQGFTNPLWMAKEVYFRKVNGLVLFNRFYSPDIDVEKLSVHSASVFSTSAELPGVIRWMGLVSSAVPQLDLAASTGVHTGGDVVKAMLAGACAVQICSTVYQNGLGVVGQMLEELRGWMEGHEFNDTGAFIGMMNWGRSGDSIAYERTQFMRYFSNHHKL